MTKMTTVIAAAIGIGIGTVGSAAYFGNRTSQLENRVTTLENQQALTTNGAYIVLEKNTNPDFPKDLFYGTVLSNPLNYVNTNNGDYQQEDMFTISKLRTASYQ